MEGAWTFARAHVDESPRDTAGGELMRYPRDQKARTRQRILRETSRALRAEGFARLSIDDLMGRLGLTHGAFYGHFPSRETLVAEACTVEYTPEEAELIVGPADAPEGASVGALIGHYLSAAHRDTPGMGCYLPALTGEVAHGSPAARTAYTRAFRRFVWRLADRMPGDTRAARENVALALMTGMAGAVAAARALDDPALSDRVLFAARAFYARALADYAPGAGQTARRPRGDATRTDGSGLDRTMGEGQV